MNTGQLTSSYVTKFVGAVALIAVALVVTSANMYLNLAPELSAEGQATLLSGVLSILFAFVIGMSFVAAAIGRESLSSLNLLQTRARQIERGNLDVELQTNKNDELGDLYRTFAAMRDGLRARIQETEAQNQRLQQRAAEYGEVMEAVGQGDLSRRLDEDAEIEAMTELAENFNSMMDRLERTVGEVHAFTDRVAEATDALEEQTDQSVRASAEVYNAAKDIEVGADPEEPGILAELDDVAIQADQSSASDTELARVGETVDAIDRLNQQMDQIDEIVEFINDVANETNMLALNAGIEATKVDGDGADGFKIVAEEVKTLAEETQNGTKEMETISRDIRDETNEAVKNILRQHAALVSIMNGHAAELSEAADDLRLTLSQLNVSDRPRESVETPSAITVTEDETR